MCNLEFNSSFFGWLAYLPFVLSFFSLAFSHGWRHWAGCPQSVFGGDFNTGVSLLEFTFPLFCLTGPDQTNLPKVVHGKYVTDTADQKYDLKTSTPLSVGLFSIMQNPAKQIPN